MSEQARRVPPHSADAERAVLGAMMKRDAAFAMVMERLMQDDFYLPAHQHVFTAMEALHMQGKPIDEVSLIDYLERRGLLKEAGGFTYITDLPRMLPAMGNLGYYIGLVEEKATLRKLIAAGEEIIGDGYSGEDELERVLASAEKRIFDISLKNTRSGLRIIGEGAVESYTKLGDKVNSTGITGLRSGLTDLDMKLSGLQKSDLIVIAARPAMGKTSFAMNIAQYAALHEKSTVAVFSLEMSREQLITRLLCTEAKVDMQHVKSGQLSASDWSRLAEALPGMVSAKLYIDDTAGITLAEISSKLRRLKLEAGALDLVVIDYLQLMTYRGKADNRQQEVSEITRALKILARDLDVPILLLSQLSRAPEQRSDHRPVLSDLRESGSIEQDADIVIMLYRGAVYDEDDGNKAEAIVQKHRNGPTGTVELFWHGEYTRFSDYSHRDD